MPPRTEMTFADLIQRIDAGGFEEEVEEELQKEVAAVQESGKTGTLTLKIKMKPASDRDGKQLFFEASCKRKAPKPTRPPAIIYADDQARLHGRDPDQVEMDLKPTPPEEHSPLRKVENGS